MAQQPVIEVNQLVKKFGDFTAVDGVSFEVYPGEIFGFLGPNGSGKTTTIRMMLGILKPTSGSSKILGTEVEEGAKGIRSRFGYMSQRFSLYNDLTVQQNLEFYASAYGLENAERRERIETTLAMAGLEGKQHTPTKDLSGGWRQRLALGVAIIHRPEVIFLDEPTSGVDPVSRRAFWDLLYGLVADGVTVFVTTHYMDEAEHCHRLAFIQDGRIIAYGSPEEIKQNTFKSKVIELTTPHPGQAIAALQAARESGQIKLEEVELYGSQVHVTGKDAGQLEKEIKKVFNKGNLTIKNLAVIEPSLEDVFIANIRRNHTDK